MIQKESIIVLALADATPTERVSDELTMIQKESIIVFALADATPTERVVSDELTMNPHSAFYIVLIVCRPLPPTARKICMIICAK